MKVVGEAEAAEEAIQKAQSDPPDLLITDIRMLGMDGLELSAAIRKLNQQLRVIMITGYEEFEYARTAVSIGVDAFLVKPVLFEELEDILRDIQLSKEREREKSEEEQQLKAQLAMLRPIARDTFLQTLLHGLILTKEEYTARSDNLNLFSRSGWYGVMLLVSATSSPHRTDENFADVQATVAEHLDTALEAASVTHRGHYVCILYAQSIMALQKVAESVKQALEYHDPALYFGLGPGVTDPFLLHDSFQRAQRALNQRFINKENRLYVWQEDTIQNAFIGKTLETLIAEFLDGLGVGDSQSSLGLLGEVMRRLVSDASLEEAPLRERCVYLVSNAYRIAGEIGDIQSRIGSEVTLWSCLFASSTTFDLLRQTVSLLTQCCDFIAERKQSPTQSVLQNALQYMNSHYAENLSLKHVAEHVFLSPNYIGELLRLELGISFTDQLIQIRIQRAKELLHDPSVKLYEVAQSVGYQNIGYFTNLFKRVTRYTPKQYRAYHLSTSTSSLNQ